MHDSGLSERINLVVAPRTMEAVKEAAYQEGATLSEYVHQAIRAQLQRTEAAQPAAGG